MTSAQPLGLFEGVGIELEYMIVDSSSLDIRPCADQLMAVVGGGYELEVDRGPAAWSNELSLHVIEIKTNGPAPRFRGLAGMFAEQVSDILDLLTPLGAKLLPTAMHPWMNPALETRLWSHADAEIYSTFDRIFGCSGHGWSNLQSMHINLPFADDEQFGRLHAAIRLVLPLLPGLAASSPVVEGALTGTMDTRLVYYRNNSAKIPAITGQLVPEAVFARSEYQSQILERIYRDMRGVDPRGVLAYEWVNARGAIARFDRMAIEIRTIDLQECPAADLAVAELVVAAVQALVSEKYLDYPAQQRFDTATLADYHERCVKLGSVAEWSDAAYWRAFGVDREKACVGDVWAKLAGELLPNAAASAERERERVLKVLLSQGTLAERITRALGSSFGREQLRSVYERLACCLAAGEMFDV